MEKPELNASAPAPPRREVDQEIAWAWERRLMAQESMEAADVDWTRAARRCRRMVRKGRHITGRPAFGDTLGEVTLRWKDHRMLVHVAVTKLNGAKDTIRFPLNWIGMTRGAWMDLLRRAHGEGDG